ncbi:MAG: hypothetical protein K9K39_07980 [Desulfohalobiaceae bacterium]|nr:hypothetical protein [Desulfohalobiaceae bacterium]
MDRPSHKELSNKLREARAAVQNRRVFLIDQAALAADAIELGYDIGGELFEVLEELLEKAGQEHYAGAHPPQKSYKDNIHGLDLYPFTIESLGLGCAVYLKFALTKDALWLVSLHKDRPHKDSL